MTIINRVVSLGLPLGELVVIGSGLLDALGLRPSRDIDLAVSPALFTRLKSSGEYTLHVKHDEEVLETDGVEIWQSWGNDESLQYEALARRGVTIDGVTFCHPDVIIARKQERGSAKDQRDITLLRRYLATHPALV